MRTYSCVFCLALLASANTFAKDPAPQQSSIEIRFCPASAVRTYPLENRRGLNSIVLHNFAIINHGQAPFKVVSIDLELLNKGQAFETKKVDGTALKQAVTRGAKMQEAKVFEMIAFQFCGDELIPPSVKLAGPALERDQGLLITSQVFAFDGARDQVRVHVHGTLGNRSTEITGTIAIKSEFAKNHYIFPLKGVWYVGVGASLHTGHRWVAPEQFGLDIGRIGETGLTHRGDGARFEDYYAYGGDVLAVADGKVIEAVDGQAEDPSAMQKPDETQEAYFARLQKEQAERLSKGNDTVTGNYVLIDHGQNEYSMSAHLQPGSVRVHKGDTVKAGDVIGKLGSSGNSTEPHLHFQITDKGDSLMAVGIPMNFTNITIQWADLPRPLQSGDVVIAK